MVNLPRMPCYVPPEDKWSINENYCMDIYVIEFWGSVSVLLITFYLKLQWFMVNVKHLGHVNSSGF